MPPKRSVAMNELDFHGVSDEQLDSYIEFVQQMIFVYKRNSPDKVKLLEVIWKDLTTERTCRLSLSAIREVTKRGDKEPDVREDVRVVLKSPKLRRSPVRKAI